MEQILYAIKELLSKKKIFCNNTNFAITKRKKKTLIQCYRCSLKKNLF